MEKHQDMKNTEQLPFKSSFTSRAVWISSTKGKTGGREDLSNYLLWSQESISGKYMMLA